MARLQGSTKRPDPKLPSIRAAQTRAPGRVEGRYFLNFLSMRDLCLRFLRIRLRLVRSVLRLFMTRLPIVGLLATRNFVKPQL